LENTAMSSLAGSGAIEPPLYRIALLGAEAG